MGEVIATCGHDVGEVEALNDAALKGYTREDERCVDYVTLCRHCYTAYKTEGLVLFGEKEINNWLSIS